MRILPLVAAACCHFMSIYADSNLTNVRSSQQILPSTFKPPQVFQNVNLLRNINLEKGYARETINVVVENVDKSPQSEYYLPFTADEIGRVGGLEAADKKDPEKGKFSVEVVEYDPQSSTQFYLLQFPTPLAPKEQLTLSISYHILSSLTPIPASISQNDKQYLSYAFSAYTPTAYTTLKQKTKLKLPTTDIPWHTKTTDLLPSGSKDPDPQIQGSTLNYGPYDTASVPPGTVHPISVRYEYTKPLIVATSLERDLEVSHWGGNLATEDRYVLTNAGATLSKPFSRVQWATTQYYNPPTSALKELKIPLAVGSVDPYFTDDIGNVSTSRFRSNRREALLELRPRYPVFGGWNYKFRIGWNNALSKFLRKLSTSDAGYVLNVPFLEGPRMPEGVQYQHVEVRVILPEGSSNVKFQTNVPLVRSETSLHKTFMDTLGRTALKLTAVNVVDDNRDSELIVTYDYPYLEGFRKPLTIFAGALAVFAAAWGIGSIDTSIRKR